MVRLAEVSKATKFGKRRGEKEESEDWLGRSYKERTVRWAISELVSVTLPRGTRGHKNMELLVARVKEVKSRLRGVGAEQDFFCRIHYHWRRGQDCFSILPGIKTKEKSKVSVNGWRMKGRQQ